MFISIFLGKDLFIWNTIFLILIGFLFFLIIGRIIQKIFSINTTNIKIAIPLGFVFYLLFNFILYIPLLFFGNLENYITFTNFIRPILIILFGIIYFEEWFPINIFKTKISFLKIENFFLFIIFLIVAVFLNIKIETFNQINYSFFNVNNSIFSSLIYSNNLANFLIKNSYLNFFYLYKWVYFILITVVLYLLITNWFNIFNFNKHISSFLSFLISLFSLFLFSFLSSSEETIYLFLLFLISFSLIKYYYFTWEKNINIYALALISMSVGATISDEGLIYLFAFFVSLNIYQLNFKDKNKQILVYSIWVFFIFSFLYLYDINFIISIIYAFAILVFLVPFSLSENKELSSTSKGTSYIVFLFALILILNLIYVIYINKDSINILDYLNNYYIFGEINKLWIGILFNSIFILIPALALFLFYFKSNKFEWLNILVIMYIIFFNPLSFLIFNNFIFDAQIDSFNIVWFFIMIDIIFKLLNDLRIQIVGVKNVKKNK